MDFGDGRPDAAALPILSTRSQHLWDVRTTGRQVLKLDAACARDEVFQALVLARIIEPTSKLDSIRVLEEVGVPVASYPTIKRRLAGYAAQGWRSGIVAACGAHAGLGPATLVLYDVTTLYFETDEG